MDADAEWKKFEAAGPEKVRENVSKQLYNKRREQLAREWLEHHADALPLDTVENVPDERLWYQKPFGIIVLGVTVSVIAAFVLLALGLTE